MSIAGERTKMHYLDSFLKKANTTFHHCFRVRDRNGYVVYRHGYMNVDVAATGGSRSSSTVNVHGGARHMNVEPDHAVQVDLIYSVRSRWPPGNRNDSKSLYTEWAPHKNNY